MSNGFLSVSQIKKIERGHINAVARHLMREDKEQWSTAHVDKNRSCYNESIIGTKDTKADINGDIIGCDMSHNTKRNPVNDVIAAELVIAPSKEFLASILNRQEYEPTVETIIELKDNPEFKRFIDSVTEALRAENCIHAYLHFDENTPHIHAILSVKHKRESKSKSEKTKRRSKKSEYVLSFNHFFGTRGNEYVLSRSSGEKRRKLEEKYGVKYDSLSTPLGQLQTRLFEKCGKPFGMKRGIAASETEIKGQSVKEWREKKAIQKIDKEVKEQIDRHKECMNKELEDKKKEIKETIQNEIQSILLSESRIMKIKKEASEQRIQEYEDKLKREEEERREIIKRNHISNLEYLENSHQENKKLYELAIQKEEAQKEIIKRLINRLEIETIEKTKMVQGFIKAHIKQLNRIAISLGYATNKLENLSNIRTLINHFSADSRFKTGRQVALMRKRIIKQLNNAIKTTVKEQLTENTINNLTM